MSDAQGAVDPNTRWDATLSGVALVTGTIAAVIAVVVRLLP